ncbi:MAG TPA: hypothetical protein DDW67_02895 [Elusimicrobia bacterium]|nr:hypothetical protein [Elusimicrobiota bacterium]
MKLPEIKDKRTLYRKLAAAGALVFLATLVTLLARHMNLGPARPAPDYRNFGPADAPIVIEEFTDFACPACRHAYSGLEEIKKAYPDKVRVVFKHYPLTNIHPWSVEAAVRADCAGRQGKFGEYAGLLFDNQNDWVMSREPQPKFDEYVGKAGLDKAVFAACMDDPEMARQVTGDMAEGDMRGINATPTFFVNGERAVGFGQLVEKARPLIISLK